ncbi:hypothetical protein YC2023_108900 [Brassica napus]|uniref:(rape) hypothetical protein n=1 Tax=Brassica napus TaxID=3708 RepID=A0A816P3Z4_BRANA|nr:unnamed protein product [Brassica napus]
MWCVVLQEAYLELGKRHGVVFSTILTALYGLLGREVYTGKMIGGSNLQFFSQNDLNDGIIGCGILFVLRIFSFLNK